MRRVEADRHKYPLAGHRGGCNKVQTAQSCGHFKGSCDCGEQLRQNLETLNYRIAKSAFEAVYER